MFASVFTALALAVPSTASAGMREDVIAALKSNETKEIDISAYKMTVLDATYEVQNIINEGYNPCAVPANITMTGNGNMALTVGWAYDTSKENIDARSVKYWEIARSIVNGAKGDDLDRLWHIFNSLCARCHYDRENKYDPWGHPASHSAAGALIEGKGVCASYARALSDMFKLAGYDSYAKIGDGHVCTMVYLDGKWLRCDATWADEGARAGYGNFLCDDSNCSISPYRETIIRRYLADTEWGKQEIAKMDKERAEEKGAQETAKKQDGKAAQAQEASAGNTGNESEFSSTVAVEGTYAPDNGAAPATGSDNASGDAKTGNKTPKNTKPDMSGKLHLFKTATLFDTTPMANSSKTIYRPLTEGSASICWCAVQ